MRFIVLIALLGLAAASCPGNSKRCFNQLLRGYGGQQQLQQYSYLDQDEYDEDELDGIDTDDYYGQQQPGCFGGRCSDDEDEYDQEGENDDDDVPCRGPECYDGQKGDDESTKCKPKYQLLRKLEQPNCHLAAKLYKQAKDERDDKSTIVSPIAVQLTVAALQKGARGNTKAQMKRAQCPGLTQRQCQQAHAAMIRTLKGTNNVQLTQKPGQTGNSQQKAKINCATGIIVNQQTCAQRRFVQSVQKCLGGQVKKCSFKTNPQQCRQQINRLVSTKTCQKVKNILPQQAVTDNTKMIAVSALQLQAKWGRQFRQQQTTKQARFYSLGSQKPKQCQVIQSQGKFNYYEDDQVKMVGIPTEQRELTVYVIVPKEKQGLVQVEKELIENGQQLKEILDICDQQKQYTRVQLPKVQLTTKIDAKKTLLKQGIQDAFDCDQADFSGICNKQRQQQESNGQKNLHLNKLIHQATLKINEQGISAANTGSQSSMIDEQMEEIQQYQQQGQYYDEDDENAYGQEQYSKYGQGTPETVVKANRAFALVVKHKPSNQIVLIGRVVDGCKKQSETYRELFQGQQEQIYDEMDEE